VGTDGAGNGWRAVPSPLEAREVVESAVAGDNVGSLSPRRGANVAFVQVGVPGNNQVGHESWGASLIEVRKQAGAGEVVNAARKWRVMHCDDNRPAVSLLLLLSGELELSSEKRQLLRVAGRSFQSADAFRSVRIESDDFHERSVQSEINARLG